MCQVSGVIKMALRELSSLERFLGLKKPNKYSSQGGKKVPVLQNNNGPALIGLVTIASHLVREAKRPELLGDSAERRAVVQQWLEHRVTRLDNCSKEEVKVILKDLNQYLEDKVYLAGNVFTLADILMYYGIHHIVVELAVQEKERYLNITRWFDHIQHYPGVRHHLPPVVVLRNRVYPSGHY
ncbi:eukaryotic translation elongation factor 1 epsilon-1 [Sinocyclocheilus rhinocerous]|uniref:GST C-terminal domain-containing protein n=1 Tax=Sinocyclocheilus rhinocerous TaxID=307959 RepID=A0A673JFF3_9TELE|nr:PREDICTED: eukaryotic translation elongation factor 1 epsilon-1 [Sinocyclocheilus rhinocerous]